MQIDLAEAYRDSKLAREAQGLLEPCVQCGQCTFTCPTFRLLDDEWDGPRGRIYLIRKLLEGREPGGADMSPGYSLEALEGRSLPANLQLHLDRCLGCRSCESSCPQGVRYGRLLDIGRELVERAAPRPVGERLLRAMLRAVVPYTRRFTLALRTGQALRRYLPPRLRHAVPTRRTSGPWPGHLHPRRVVIWQGCVQPALAPEINAAAARVLDRLGIQALAAGDGCCGAISQHTAAPEQARAFMRDTIDALWPHIENGAEAVVLTASGCGMHIREYGQLLQDDPLYAERARRLSELARDIAEIVAEEWKEEPPAPGHRPRVAFQSSCSLQHGERLNGVVEQILQRAGYKVLRVAYPFMCCGAAGAYSLLQRGLSEALRAHRLETLMATRPELIATANIGCLAHLAPVSPVPVRHWIDLLDKALAHGDRPATAGGSPPK
jgi:glycolate oxidase iron-sulfur subunit